MVLLKSDDIVTVVVVVVVVTIAEVVGSIFEFHQLLCCVCAKYEQYVYLDICGGTPY